MLITPLKDWFVFLETKFRSPKLKNRVGSQTKEDHKSIWIFGIHSVAQALTNPKRHKLKLMATPNAVKKLEIAIQSSGLVPTIIDPRKFSPPIDKQSIHQGVALEVVPLKWDSLSEICAPKESSPIVILLDRVTDPHNVGAIIRTAQALGVRAVIAPNRYSAKENGALVKASSGAVEDQPYLQIPNLARGMAALKEMNYFVVGLDETAKIDLPEVYQDLGNRPIAFVLGSEGSGLRELTKKLCDVIVGIKNASNFGSLNVSNAAAIAMFTAREHLR